MPLKSKAQMRKLWATNPRVAREFTDATPNLKKLPEYVRGSPAAKKRKK
jgi:hypothetical protein